MGIQGLLPLLKSIMFPIHIKDLQGCFVAVDTYSWLHKGALSCSKDLCTGQPTSRHIDYCMHRVNLLRHYGVKPILVFDGGLLPMKSDQENKRSRARKENLERAIEHESTGNSAAAYECYQKAVDISPSIAFELIQVLKQENVDYIVAPYEADAQMTFLFLNKHVDAIITEDSDLIPFGCSRIIFKMDKFGQGVEFLYSMLPRNKELNFTGFTKQMLLEMCILSGCDYLPSLPGMGLKRAHALVQKFKSYDKVIKHLRYSAVSVPPFYEETFKKALWTFLHQRVYDPTNEDIVHLSEIPNNLVCDLDFLGPSIPQSVAKGIAKGDLDPFTKLPLQGAIVHAITYPVKEFKLESERKKLELPAQKNVLTNYFCLASLEAKRKFKAPRVIPKYLDSMEESSPSPDDPFCDLSCSSEEASACTINGSQGSRLGDGLPLNDSMEDGLVTSENQLFELPPYGKVANHVGDNLNSPQHVVSLRQSKDEVFEPPISLRKEHECNLLLEAIEGKSGLVNRKVTVRSSYFQPKLLDENDHANENEKLVVKKQVVRSRYFQPKLLDENGHGNENEKPVVKKQVVRSHYFQPKLLDENEHGNENEKHTVKKQDASDVIHDYMVPESASSGNCHLKSAIKKRKSSPPQTRSTQNEIEKVKHTRKYGSLSAEGNFNPDSNSKNIQTDVKEGNFGSNISHLSHYSEIAEKSMERFVSVMSSFNCTSSGSRASGLRAPLKDVRNTYPIRSTTVPVDLSKFSYVPSKKKTAYPSQRLN
ncbi:5'-3' exonuclease family protein [Tasmannia lanceolata]|uniref:5'-3' exonuclease family protein n=1 Tax=Tasmannia lanceolata TaxID=3420 RepID=UPI0040640B48